MYNLFVSSNTDAWNGDPYIYEIDRCVNENEYTDTEIAGNFGELDAKAIAELKRLPSIFAYETFCRKPPKFGMIRAITKRKTEVRIQYEISDVEPFLTFDDLSALASNLDIRRFEMNRTHWAVKDIDLARELEFVRGISLLKWVQSTSNTIDIETHFFDVALSFPGEIRPLVEQIVIELTRNIGPNSCFYDNHYLSQLARPSLDLLLQNIYRNRAKLIVVFLSSDYQRKDWCGLEWHAIREIIKERDHKKVMYFKTDDGKVDGVFNTDGYIDARKYSPEENARFIQERLESLRGNQA